MKIKKTKREIKKALGMVVGLAQMDVIAGRVDLNLKKMLQMIAEAKNKCINLLVFPEMCVGGYLLSDEYLVDDYIKDLMSVHKTLLKASRGIAIAFGNVYLDPEKKINERTNTPEIPRQAQNGLSRRYNSIVVIQNGRYAKRKKESCLLPPGVQPKTLLPNYRMFDDKRYFFSLLDIAADFNVAPEELNQPFLIEVDGTKIPVGFECCEDLWFEDYRKNNCPVNPSEMLINNGARFIVNISSSPWTIGKNNSRDRRILKLKQYLSNKMVPLLYVNNVGAQNTGKNIITFDGGSTSYNTDGFPVQFVKEPYKEGLLVVDDSVIKNPSLTREEKPVIEQKFNAIIRGIRHLKDMMGLKDHPKFVIGVSGGIDSAVVCTLVTVAVGKEKVLAVNLPTRYNSVTTKEASKILAANLGIGYRQLSIEKIVSEVKKLVTNSNEKNHLESLVAENIQARIRGADALAGIAASEGAVFTNNGNKVETILGYATLYGDVGGAIAPIADLTKEEVYQMGLFLNQYLEKEIIPRIIFEIKPSAELKENQVDPIKVGYHDKLVEKIMDYRKTSIYSFMEWYLKGTLEKNLGLNQGSLKKFGLNDPAAFLNDLEWFFRCKWRSVFKRVQAPPIIILSKTAFGYDLRESILPSQAIFEGNRFEKLKTAILKSSHY